MELGKDLVEAPFQERDQIDIIAFKNASILSWLKLLVLPLGDYLSFGAAPIAEQGDSSTKKFQNLSVFLP